MPLLAVASWVVLRLLRQPLGWLWAVAMVALWGATLLLSPVGLTTRSPGAVPLVYEIAFVSCLTGVALALAPLGEGEWFLRLVAPGRRLAARWAGLLAGGALGLALGALVPVAIARNLHLEPEALLRGAGGCLLHTAALGVLLLRTPVPTSVRPLLLALLAWLVPASLPAAGALGHALRRALDVARHLDPARADTPLAFASGLLPIAGLALAGVLLERAPMGSRTITPAATGREQAVR